MIIQISLKLISPLNMERKSFRKTLLARPSLLASGAWNWNRRCAYVPVAECESLWSLLKTKESQKPDELRSGEKHFIRKALNITSSLASSRCTCCSLLFDCCYSLKWFPRVHNKQPSQAAGEWRGEERKKLECKYSNMQWMFHCTLISIVASRKLDKEGARQGYWRGLGTVRKLSHAWAVLQLYETKVSSGILGWLNSNLHSSQDNW
jgi:hypothetical protein